MMTNRKTGGRRSRHAGVAITAVLGVALLATGCGGEEKKNGTSGQTKEDQHKQALGYAKCMRSNGVASWPDPSSSGAFPNENGSLDRLRKSAGYQKASAACKSLESTGSSTSS
jgi:hypothetical protein